MLFVAFSEGQVFEDQMAGTTSQCLGGEYLENQALTMEAIHIYIWIYIYIYIYIYLHY